MSNLNGTPAPQPAQQVTLTGEQLAAMLVIEGLLTAMSTAVNQLGGFVKYEAAANIIAHAGSVLGRDYQALKENWHKVVQLAPANALPVISSKH